MGLQEEFFDQQNIMIIIDLIFGIALLALFAKAVCETVIGLVLATFGIALLILEYIIGCGLWLLGRLQRLWKLAL